MTLTRAALLEGHGPPDPHGARGRGRLAVAVGRRICPTGVRVHTEYPELTRRFLEKHGVDAEISLSYGATEAKIPEIADAVVEITETGRALRAAGLQGARHDPRVVHRADREPDRRTPTPTSARRWSSSRRCCIGALEARGRVLVKLNVDEANLARGDRPAARAEVADGVEAVRRGRLRGRDGRRQERHQHAHPGAEGRTARPASSRSRSPRSSSERVTRGTRHGVRRAPRPRRDHRRPTARSTRSTAP